MQQRQQGQEAVGGSCSAILKSEEQASGAAELMISLAWQRSCMSELCLILGFLCRQKLIRDGNLYSPRCCGLAPSAEPRKEIPSALK